MFAGWFAGAMDWVSLDAGSTLRARCHEAVCAGERELPQTPAVLGYGESTRAAGFSCAVSPQGVACREDATGHGFWLRSEAYLLF